MQLNAEWTHSLKSNAIVNRPMFDRITSDPGILGGKPIIRGTRISVEMVLEWVASGASRDEILLRSPHLSSDDVEQALGYAAAAVRNEILATGEVVT